MTALGIDMSSRDVDLFYWPKPSHHGKPDELLRVEGKIDMLWGRHLRLCDIVPLPNTELDEIRDEIKYLEKIKTRLWNDWQQSISNQRKEMVRQ
jgi:predicted nucleotidyltransferase